MVISFLQTNALDAGTIDLVIDYMLLCQTGIKNWMQRSEDTRSIATFFWLWESLLSSLELVITFMVLPDFTTF